MVLQKQNNKTKLILFSGPAGAGRTTAIRSLEDLGFEAIDNLPLDLVQSVLKPEKTSEYIAIGLDAAKTRAMATHSLVLRSGDVLGLRPLRTHNQG